MRVSTAFAIAILSALEAASTGCGGGGPADELDQEAGSASPPSPPPFAPRLYIERDPDGATFVRVEEQVFDPFAPNEPLRTIADLKIGPDPGKNHRIEGPETTLVRNVDAGEMKYGLQLQESAKVSIYDYTYSKWNGGSSIYGAAIKLGDNKKPTNDATYIQRVVADGQQPPDGSYKISNTDFIGIERESGPVFIRDVTGRNFGDAGIDNKSTPVYVMNATLDGAHRMLRVWGAADVVIANSIVNAPPNQAQVWLKDATANLSYYNVLWCRGATNPSPADPNCRDTPLYVQGDSISSAAAAGQIERLSANPLPDASPFFATRIDRIVVEYASDKDAAWRRLPLSNAGENGVAPLGDPRYPIPLNLSDAEYRFRAWYERNGARVGAVSSVINEAGDVAP